MKGLIKKDLLMIKSNFRILVILLFVYGFMALNGEMDLFFILPFMSVMVMISTFSYDAYNKWDAYVVTLPNGRKNSVRAKYIATLLLIGVATVVITILSIIISYVRTNDMMLLDNLSMMVGYLFATLLLQALMYPTIYKFGLEKARIGIFIGAFLIAIILEIAVKFVDLATLINTIRFINNYYMIIFPLVMIIMVYISYKISEKIYLKKEF